ncbi:GL13304 [Drosophila persimilis]|uniref:GL13304 n=1 Tax=Drosophila persimilis TaxID=7234 RepID=B4H2Y4_DROPE|nr:GL13304 [Drosophila persimilis]
MYSYSKTEQTERTGDRERGKAGRQKGSFAWKYAMKNTVITNYATELQSPSEWYSAVTRRRHLLHLLHLMKTKNVGPVKEQAGTQAFPDINTILKHYTCPALAFEPQSGWSIRKAFNDLPEDKTLHILAAVRLPDCRNAGMPDCLA